jgi:hypothetical protein
MTNPPDPTPGDPLGQPPPSPDPPPQGAPPPPPPGQPPPPGVPPAPAPPPGYAPAPGAPAAAIPQQPGQPGVAVAGLVLGIISILAPILCGVFALPIGIAGIICSYIGRNQARERGLPTSMATAGLICAIVGTVLSVLLAILIGTLIITTSS